VRADLSFFYRVWLGYVDYHAGRAIRRDCRGWLAGARAGVSALADVESNGAPRACGTRPAQFEIGFAGGRISLSGKGEDDVENDRSSVANVVEATS
jgi:hypothetical protein